MKQWQWEVKGKEKRGEEEGAQALTEMRRSHFGDPQPSCVPGLRSFPHSSFRCWAQVLPEKQEQPRPEGGSLPLCHIEWCRWVSGLLHSGDVKQP